MRSLIVFLRHLKAFLLKGRIREPYYFINEKVNVAYLNNEKVACSAIKSSLYGIVHDNGENPDSYKNELRSVEIRVPLSHSQLNNYYKFTFVRNPFERLYSCYKDKIMNKGNKKVFKYRHYLFGYLHEKESFESFANKVCNISDSFSDEHFRSQSFSILEGNKSRVDYIGRFETFDKDFQLISDKFGFEIPRENNKSGAAETWKAAYNSQLVERVHKRFTRDFTLWYPHAKEELMLHINQAKEND